MTTEEYEIAWKQHFTDYLANGSHEEAAFKADLVMGIAEVVSVLNRIEKHVKNISGEVARVSESPG